MGEIMMLKKKVTGTSICELFMGYKCSVEGNSLILIQVIQSKIEKKFLYIKNNENIPA